VEQGTISVAKRQASIMEDPANRRVNGGGKVRFVVHLIPMTAPHVITTSGGPGIVHSSDFTPISARIDPRRQSDELQDIASIQGKLFRRFAVHQRAQRGPVRFQQRRLRDDFYYLGRRSDLERHVEHRYLRHFERNAREFALLESSCLNRKRVVRWRDLRQDVLSLTVAVCVWANVIAKLSGHSTTTWIRRMPSPEF
jgi:hypothetical protein